MADLFGGGAVNLGSAYGVIGIKFADNQINAALGSLDTTISARMLSIGKKFQNVGANLTFGLAPITGFVSKGVLAYAEFDDILTEIEARTGATAGEMERVRATAMEMGKTTAFSATDASQAMLELLASGYGLDQALIALLPTLNAAAAGEMELGQAADSITDILAQFQLEASDAAYVADVLAKSSGASSATMFDMVQAFNNVGPIAARFGLSVEDTAAVLAVFAENGIKGAEAGTQLKSMLTNMTRQTEDVQGAWQELGFSLYDATGNLRPLNDVILDLDNAMKTMTVEEQNTLIQTLAGSYGQMGLSALLASDGIGAMQTAMGEAAGASEVADARISSLKGQANLLASSLETLSITVLGPMAELYLKPLLGQVTNVINKLTEWAQANPELAAKIGLVLAALAILGPTLIVIGTMFTLMGTAIAVLTSPIMLLVIAIGLLAYVWTKFGADATQSAQMLAFIVLYYLTQAAQTATLIALMFEGAFKYIVDVVNRAGVSIQMLAFIIMYYLTQASTTAQMAIFIIVYYLNQAAQMASLIVLVIEAAFIYLKSKIDEFIDGAETKFQTGLNNITNLWSLFKLMVSLLILSAVNYITTKFTEIVDTITTKATAAYDAAVGFGNDILDGIKEAIGDTANWAQTNIINPIVNTISGAGSAITNAIKGIIPSEIDLGPLGSVGIPTPSFLTGRALGGDVFRNTPYLVGERGPEVFIPGITGSILPNNRLMDIVSSAFGGRSAAPGQAAQAGRQEVYNFYGDINLPTGSMPPTNDPRSQANNFFEALKTERTRLGGGTINA